MQLAFGPSPQRMLWYFTICPRSTASAMGLLRAPRRRTTDVEGPHRELRAGLTDGLRRDDADGLAEVRPSCPGRGRGRST